MTNDLPAVEATGPLNEWSIQKTWIGSYDPIFDGQPMRVPATGLNTSMAAGELSTPTA